MNRANHTSSPLLPLPGRRPATALSALAAVLLLAAASHQADDGAGQPPPPPSPESWGTDQAGEPADELGGDLGGTDDLGGMDDFGSIDDFGEGDASLDNFDDFADLDLDALIEEPMVITGGKRMQRLSTALSSITIFTREDIEQSPYLYLGELLASVPGLDVRWGMMQRLFVGARGLGGTSLNSRMLLLVDSQPMNDPYTGELNVGHFFPLSDIEQIEVIRGPGSTLYGANAFSGVVNVLTRNPFANQRVSVLYGSNQTARIEGKVSEWVGPVALGASIEAFTTEGPFEAQYLEREEPIEFKNDDARGINLAANASWEGLTVGSRFSLGERGRPGTFPTDHQGNILECSSCHSTGSPHGKGVKYPAAGTSCGQCHAQPFDREYVMRGGAIASFDRELFSNVRLSVNGYHNEWRNWYDSYADEEFFREKNAREVVTEQRLSGGEVHVSHVLGTTNNVVVGAEARRSEVASTGMITPEGGNWVEASEAAVFAEDEVSPFGWLSFTAGGRLDFSSMFDIQVSPRAGLALLPIEGLSLRGVVSRAFRNPNFAELYLYDTRGAYIVLGNPDLEPELVTTYEGKVDYTLNLPLTWHMGANLYYSQAENLIALRTTSLSDATFYNLNEVNVLGTELETDLTLKGDPGIKVFANYAFQQVRDQADRPLPYAPPHKFNTGIRANSGRLGASMIGHYVGERLDPIGIELPGYATVDATVSFHVWNAFGLRLWAQNLTDTLYQESLGIPGRRRSFFVVLYYDNAKSDM